MRSLWLLVVFMAGCLFLSVDRAVAQSAVELSRFEFREAPPRSGTGMRIKQTGPNSVRFAMTSAKHYGSEWFYAEFEYGSTAQQKLAFRAKGSPKNGTAFFHPILVIRDGKRSRTVTGPRVAVDNGDYRLYVFGLDTDFHLGDGRYTIEGLQFSFNSAQEPAGRELTVEVDGIRFANPDEVANRTAAKIVVVRPKTITDVSAPKRKQTSVYFEFDNNDTGVTLSMARHNAEPYEDNAGDFSYRRLLLEHCPLFVEARRPEDADILVYQRTTPSERAETLARLAKSGKPLVLYGAVPDAALSELSPLKLTRHSADGFVPREKLAVSAATGPIRAMNVQDCTFARYFDAQTVDGAETLLEFASSHTPYLARKGNVFHVAGTSGTTLVASSLFYDKAALLLWSEMAKRDDLPKELAALEANALEVKASEVKTLENDGLTWYRTTDGFGRFGWQIGENGLVDAVSSDLTVSNGDQLYRIDVPDWNGPELRLQGKCSDTRKQYRLVSPGKPGTVSFDISLLTPFKRWRFEKIGRVFLTQENIAEYAAWRTAEGVKIQRIPTDPGSRVLFDVEKDGRWSAPWLLLYREKESRPLLLIFSRQPRKIVSRIRYGILDGFELDLAPDDAKEPATLLAGWPWGVTKRDFPGCGVRMSGEMQRRIRHSLDSALVYPLERTEHFAVDPRSGRIHFRMDVSFERIADEWKSAASPRVFLPPLTAFMWQEGNAGRLETNMVETAEPLYDDGVATPSGPLLGKTGTTFHWSLPLPDRRDLLLAQVHDEKRAALRNKLFLDGVKWSCGGHVPLEAWTPQHPNGANAVQSNISFFSWNFGICTALQGQLLLNAEAKKQLWRRVAVRTLEPIELYQPKAFARHRCEPFSGKCYPVMFDSYYPNTTRYEPGFGSGVIYGDTNEATVVTAWSGQLLADLCGMPDAIRANWNFYRYVARHQWYLDDYCFHAGSCRESGVGAWIDMLNAEYCGMLAHARLAEIAGDERESAEALARAAKKAIPTVARLYFRPWLERLRPELKDRSYLVTGFGKDGAKIMTYPNASFNFFGANDLFDFSQGIPGTQYHLYRRYAWKKIQEYLSEKAFPSLVNAGEYARYDYAAALGLYDDALPNVLKYTTMVESLPKNQKAEDWPGITRAFQIACTQWRLPERLAFSQFRNLRFERADYEPATNTLTAECEAGTNSFLEVMSDRRPVGATRNGQQVTLSPNGVFYSMPLVPGKNLFVVEFEPAGK